LQKEKKKRESKERKKEKLILYFDHDFLFKGFFSLCHSAAAAAAAPTAPAVRAAAALRLGEAKKLSSSR